MINKGVLIGDTDHGKVCLLVNLTLEDKGKKEFERMKYLSKKYGEKDFAVYGQFTYDVQSGEKMSNKEIAH